VYAFTFAALSVGGNDFKTWGYMTFTTISKVPTSVFVIFTYM